MPNKKLVHEGLTLPELKKSIVSKLRHYNWFPEAQDLEMTGKIPDHLRLDIAKSIVAFNARPLANTTDAEWKEDRRIARRLANLRLLVARYSIATR